MARKGSSSVDTKMAMKGSALLVIGVVGVIYAFAVKNWTLAMVSVAIILAGGLALNWGKSK